MPFPCRYGQPGQVGRSITDRVYPSNNGILYGGSLGRASAAAAHSAMMRGGPGMGGAGWERSSFELSSAGARPYGFLHKSPMPAPPPQEAELAQEARLLRQHKTRLESRMQLLEDHNKALEDQLNRLRQYLNIPSATTPTPVAQSFDQNPQSVSRRFFSPTHWHVDWPISRSLTVHAHLDKPVSERRVLSAYCD